MADPWTLSELTELDLRLQRGLMQETDPLPEDISGDSKADVIRAWLERGREEESEAGRLARMALHSMTLLSLGVGIFSFLAGISAAGALLRYQDSPLMNVSTYLALLVGGQLLMLILLGIGMLIFRRQLSALTRFYLPKVIKQLRSPLSLRAWSWRMFLLSQSAGILFNCGILLMTFGKGLTQDLAFGWATTLDADSHQIHRIVETLALPWGGAAPTLDQIEHSRIIHSAGLRVTQRNATAAWWPFLMRCVFIYGALPRALLFAVGQIRYRLALRHPPLDDPECERLYLRLTRKSLTFANPAPEQPASKDSVRQLQALQPAGPLRLEVNAELLSSEQQSAFTTLLRENLQLELDPESQAILKVVELWQPPLEETLRELRTLREQAGADNDILLLGVGFPENPDKGFFQSPATTDIEVWSKRLAELNDPHLGLIPWRTSI